MSGYDLNTRATYKRGYDAGYIEGQKAAYRAIAQALGGEPVEYTDSIMWDEFGKAGVPMEIDDQRWVLNEELIKERSMP